MSGCYGLKRSRPSSAGSTGAYAHPPPRLAPSGRPHRPELLSGLCVGIAAKASTYLP